MLQTPAASSSSTGTATAADAVHTSNAKRKRHVGKTVVQPTTLIGPSMPMPMPHTPSIIARSERKRTTQRKISSTTTLDGFMLLDVCRVEFPDDVTQVVLSGLNIRHVIAEDLLFFTNLTRLDMSDNEAPFEPFGSLPALIELDFQCNALSDARIGGGFLTLEVLNLSFNCLTSRDIEELSNLLRIRELYLANNWIRSLPPMMDRFSRLETLSLEHNNIVGDEIFSFLALVPRLRNLNLSHNKLTGCPASALQLPHRQPPPLASGTTNPNATAGGAFYQLLYLNLAHNQILDEASVLATCDLYALRKLVLYGNPLAHAAVCSHDKTKLAYDPIPTMHARIAETQKPLTIVLAYPETKKKKKQTMAMYENVDIYKMLPNEIPLQPTFRTRSTDLMGSSRRDDASESNDDETEREEKKKSTTITTKSRFVENSDSTFLTGVGIEDVLGNLDQINELPAVPSAVITRSLATSGNKNANPMKARAAINALRYQLAHPLTSHDDSEILPLSCTRPTMTQTLRQLPRHRYDSINKNASAFTTAVFRNRKVGGVDDALTKLSHQVATAYDKRAGTSTRG